MNAPGNCVFVCGVTGNQGGTLARKLVQLGWTVHATARDLEAPRALALATLGALRASLVSCDKIFINLVSTVEDFDRERRQAAAISMIAKDVGVRQAIVSTSLVVSLYNGGGHLGGVLEPGSILHALVKVKHDVEETVRSMEFESCTFLRPGYFMANFLEPVIESYSEILSKNTQSTVFKAETQLGLTDHEDIASIAVEAFRDSNRFNGRAIGLVSEFLTPQETMDYLGSAMGRSGLKAIFLNDSEVSALPAGSFDNPYVKGDKCLEYMAQVIVVQPGNSYDSSVEGNKVPASFVLCRV
ncbi:NmrA family protein [Xylaria digitata]|nr:NmrA family protein [Xylaria digitata]